MTPKRTRVCPFAATLVQLLSVCRHRAGRGATNNDFTRRPRLLGGVALSRNLRRQEHRSENLFHDDIVMGFQFLFGDGGRFFIGGLGYPLLGPFHGAVVEAMLHSYLADVQTVPGYRCRKKEWSSLVRLQHNCLACGSMVRCSSLQYMSNIAPTY